MPIDEPARVVAFHRRLRADLLGERIEPLRDAVERLRIHHVESQQAGLGWRWATSAGRMRLTVFGALAHGVTAVPPLFFVGRARATAYERACLAAEKGSLDDLRARFAVACADHRAARLDGGRRPKPGLPSDPR